MAYAALKLYKQDNGDFRAHIASGAHIGFDGRFNRRSAVNRAKQYLANDSKTDAFVLYQHGKYIHTYGLMVGIFIKTVEAGRVSWTFYPGSLNNIVKRFVPSGL